MVFLPFHNQYKSRFMAIKITNECINCSSCESVCPNKAIYAGGIGWRLSDGTNAAGAFTLKNNTVIHADETQAALSPDTYYIVPDKCTECVGFHDTPQCASVCPIECCVPDEQRRESEFELLKRKESLH